MMIRHVVLFAWDSRGDTGAAGHGCHRTARPATAPDGGPRLPRGPTGLNDGNSTSQWSGTS